MGHITEQTLQAIDREIMRLIDLGDMTKETLECLDKLIDMKKDTLKSAMMEEGEQQMDQNRSYNYGYDSNNRGSRTYYDGGSYAYRRNVRTPYNMGSRESEREQIISKIEQQLDMAQTDNEREMIHRILNIV